MAADRQQQHAPAYPTDADVDAVIAEAAGDAIRGGWANLLFLAAFISINLGIVNLLPIPVMDGGLLVFCGLEGLRGRPLGARAQKMVNLAGMAAVGGLMVTVVANDVLYLIHRPCAAHVRTTIEGMTLQLR